MELKPGMSALVTGGASGIGKALSFALAQKGIFLTIVDYSEEKGKEVAFMIEKENKKFNQNRQPPLAVFVKCDVTETKDIAAAFEKHMETFGGLDVCINSAGIGTEVLFHQDETDGYGTWRHTVNVNLVAVIDCTRIAIQTMRSRKKPGVIINIASASGLYPMYNDPIYSATKVSRRARLEALVLHGVMRKDSCEKPDRGCCGSQEISGSSFCCRCCRVPPLG